jgi:hypothetical protein
MVCSAKLEQIDRTKLHEVTVDEADLPYPTSHFVLLQATTAENHAIPTAK